MTNTHHSYPQPSSIYCRHSLGKANGNMTYCNNSIPFNSFRIFHNRKGSKHNYTIKGRCKGHWIFICPVCYRTSNQQSGIDNCFHKHNTRCDTCLIKCTSTDQYITNHLINNPDSPFDQEGKRLTMTQKRKELTNSVQENRLEQTTTAITTLREYNDNGEIGFGCESVEGISSGCGQYEQETITQSERSKFTFHDNIMKCLIHRLSCNEGCKGREHLPQSLPREISGSHVPFPSMNHLHFTIKHKIQSSITDNNMDLLLKDLHQQYLIQGRLEIPRSVYDMNKFIERVPRLTIHNINDNTKTP